MAYKIPAQDAEDIKTRMKQMAQQVHRAGYPFIAIGVAITLILLLIAPVLGLLAAIVTAWIVYFFRDPVRVVPEDESLILSPADGTIQSITKAAPPHELAEKITDPQDSGEDKTDERTRISIFLDIFDVHVTRIPVSGQVEKGAYTKGAFINAAFDKASEKNERCGLIIRRPDDSRLVVVQIAGLIARRIVCDVKSGDQVRAGQRYGIIRFGSRVDIYLPPGMQPRVAVGQRAIGGETVLAERGDSRNNLQTRRD